MPCVRYFYKILLFLVFVLFLPSTVEASAFLQWSRRLELPTANISIVASSAGIVVISTNAINTTDQSYQTQIINSTNGVVLVSISHPHFYDQASIIRPAETSDGKFVCEKLMMSQSNHTLPPDALYCGVFLMSSNESSVPPAFLMPNGTLTSFPNLGWECSEEFPCETRGPEQRQGQIGGCHRQANPSPFLPNYFAPQSSVVVVADRTSVFIFRPLLVVTGVGSVKIIKRETWFSSRPTSVDHGIQFLSLPYQALPSAIPHQAVICALAIIGKRGNITLYDADRENSTTMTGMPYLGYASSPHTDGSPCIPTVKSVMKLAPTFTASSPTINPIYFSVIAIQCVDGQGFFWDVILTENDPLNAPVSEPVVAALTHSGMYRVPANFSLVNSSGPDTFLFADVSITLVQPSVNYASRAASLVYASKYLTYVTAVAIYSCEPSIGVQANMANKISPAFVTMVFTSGLGSKTAPYPGLTNTQVSSAPSNLIYIDIGEGPKPHAITQKIGWVIATSLPASVEANFSTAFIDPNSTKVGADVNIDAMLSLVARQTAQWIATYGIVFSALSADLALLVNATTGQAAQISSLVLDQKYDADNIDSPGLSGGVMLARPTRLNPYTEVAYFPSTLDWQDVVPLIDQTAPPPMYMTHIVATTPSELSPSQPMCVYTLRDHVGGVDTSIRIDMRVGPFQNLSWRWLEANGEVVLLYPYTQSYCAVSEGSALPGIIPAGDQLIVKQLEGEHVRAAAIPLRDVVKMTAQVSFLLSVNVTQTPNRRLETLHPIGTRMIYVCDVNSLLAYSNIIGNLSWTYNFSSLPGCSNCVCSEQDTSLLLTADRNYIILRVTNQTKPSLVSSTFIIVHAQDGSVIDFFNTTSIATQSSECGVDPNVMFSAMTEITQASPQFAFLGVSVIPNSRCFSLVSLEISTDEDGNYFYTANAYMFFFLGSVAQFDPNVAWLGDSLFLANIDNGYSTSTTFGHNVWAFSITSLVKSFTPILVSIGALPTFAANDVLDSIAYSSLWFAVQVQNTDIGFISVALQAFDTTNLATSLWSVPLDYFSVNDTSDMELVGVFIVRNQFVCASTGSLWCMPIDAALGDVLFLSGIPNPHYGMPAIDQWGAMIFATPPYPIHAVRFASTDNGPTHLWTSPWWPGDNESVDMNINVTTCTDPQLSDELLLVICSPTYDPFMTEYQRHMFLVDSDTGEVMLGNGPWAKPGLATFSDSGLSLIYVNNLATAVSLELVGTVVRIAIDFNGDLCRSEGEANYALSITAEGIVAKLIPWNASLPWVVRNYNNTLYAQQAVGYRDLMLGKTFVLVDSNVMLALWDALSPTVQSQGSINVFVGETVSIMTADFGQTLMDASLCVVCQIGCPDYCAVDFFTGSQFSYQFSPTFITVYEKPYLSYNWNQTPGVLTEPFSGNVSLDLYRFWANRKPSQQMVDCHNETSPLSITQRAPSGRFCAQASRQSYKKWVVVEISHNASFAVTTTYSTLWTMLKFTSLQTSQLEPIYSVAGDIAIAHMLEDGMESGSFPNDLVTGEDIGNILSVSVNHIKNVSQLLITTTGGVVVVLDNATCVNMDADLPVCSSRIEHFYDDEIDTTIQSIYWTRSGGSNWGDGFVQTGYETNLANLMRTVSTGEPQTCGTLDASCYSQCQPTSECSSQLTGFFSTILYVLAWLPAGSVLPYPSVVNQSCFYQEFDHPVKANQQRNRLRAAKLHDYNYDDPSDPAQKVISSQPNEFRVSFQCTTQGRVMITLAIEGSPEPIVMADLSSYASQAYIGANFTCTVCTYFILQGIIAEPFGWLAVGAVKSLVVCIMFYWMMEKVKERQRTLNELNRKWKRHEKQKRAIILRILALKQISEAQDTENGLVCDEDADETAFHIVNHSFLAKQSLKSRPIFYQPRESGINTTAIATSPYMGRMSFRARETLPNLTRSSADALGTADVEVPRASINSAIDPANRMQRPVDKLTDDERRDEMVDLKMQLVSIGTKIRIDQAEQETLDEKQWCLSKHLRNPIDLYAAAVVRLSRFRRLEDRRLQVTRIKDNFVYKEFTPESLVEMLMAILGESPSNRAQVVSFAHFYQWNLCDNRQWVVREHVDEQSQFASPEVLDGLEYELQLLQNDLQDLYVWYKIAFGDQMMNKDDTKPYMYDFTHPKENEPLLSSEISKSGLESPSIMSLNTRPKLQTSQGPLVTSMPTLALSLNQAQERGSISKPIPLSSAGDDIRASPKLLNEAKLTAIPLPVTNTPAPVKKKVNRRDRLNEAELRVRQITAQQAHEKMHRSGLPQPNPGEPPIYTSERESEGPRQTRTAAEKIVAELTKEASFAGLDAFVANQRPNDGKSVVSRARSVKGYNSERSKTRFAGDADSFVDVESEGQQSVGRFGDIDTPTTGDAAGFPSGDIDDELEDDIEKAVAKINLKNLVEEFNQLHDLKPHCFEYASLPSRKIDDKLLPSPLLIIFSLLETLITLCVYSGNVLIRSYNGNNGTIRAFDMYQCVFFLVFNSSLPSSLIVNVIARADLGKTTHTKNALEKVKDIITNPYVIITLLMLGVPMATHVIPGFVVFIWLMAPALAISFAAEYYLRTRITVQSHFVVLGRLTSRVLILFTVSISLSLSYNYSASYIWSDESDGGYLSSGSFKKMAYFDIIVQDYNSRSFSCTYEHIVDAIANFVQMGFFFL